MDNYRLLKFNQAIKSHRVKFLGLWLLSVLNKRYLSIQMDPVLACNLRCKMCYFTDDEFVRKNMKGMFKQDDLEPIANATFKNALKLQIGCGAEPTLFKHNTQLIELAKRHKVPYISMVTNGNLLSAEDVAAFANAGLNEIIMSLHGVHKASYEDLMDKGNYEKFHAILAAVTEQKKTNPNFRLRINYTFNKDNFHELADFFEVYGDYAIDIIQLRPIDKIGETTYNDFSLKSIENDFPGILKVMKEESAKRHITLLAPHSVIRNEEESLKVQSGNDSSYLKPYTYFYISPKYSWKDDYDWRTETFAAWQKRSGWNLELLRNAFRSRKGLEQVNRNMLNYSVDIN
ncbi:radical SAM protein [Flavobacterium sp. MFBS3-15]|uniref:radical SAM protein n=1 Tax=Flavobacterium sp. MFBS3-15 TaxID=2989816 RepID=UPI002236BC02|nr:radical SAM protein [Flavobacterium sp. MFBS3-15]MCW4469173.1 radical SAM protein [Flavobacterium sp. MFBS3-15]